MCTPRYWTGLQTQSNLRFDLIYYNNLYHTLLYFHMLQARGRELDPARGTDPQAASPLWAILMGGQGHPPVRHLMCQVILTSVHGSKGRILFFLCCSLNLSGTHAINDIRCGEGGRGLAGPWAGGALSCSQQSNKQ